MQDEIGVYDVSDPISFVHGVPRKMCRTSGCYRESFWDKIYCMNSVRFSRVNAATSISMYVYICNRKFYNESVLSCCISRRKFVSDNIPQKDVHYALYYCTSCVLQHHKTYRTVWQYHNRSVSDTIISFSCMLMRYITAFKKNVCCGKIIPPNVSFQLWGTDNWSKCRHHPARPIIRFSERLYCFFDDLIIASAVSGLHDLLRSSSARTFCQSLPFTCLHVKQSLREGPADFTGQACRPRYVQDTRE
jgi:hypothetical protein